jgi:hypothetical protein
MAIAGCSETDLENLQEESNNEESEEDEDSGEQTGPEAAVEQLRTGLISGDADLINEVSYTGGENSEVDDTIEPSNIETIEYEVTEVSPADYESQTRNDFAEQKIELTETGGDDFAIIKWSEEYIRESEKRSFEQYYLLHKINQEWLIVTDIGSERAESEDEETQDGPKEPLVVGVNVQASPQIRVSVDIRNPTDETVERRLWVRVASKDGGTLATRSRVATLSPTGGEPAVIPFLFDGVAWSGNAVNTDDTEAVLTATDAESPF